MSGDTSCLNADMANLSCHVNPLIAVGTCRSKACQRLSILAVISFNRCNINISASWKGLMIQLGEGGLIHDAVPRGYLSVPGDHFGRVFGELRGGLVMVLRYYSLWEGRESYDSGPIAHIFNCHCSGEVNVHHQFLCLVRFMSSSNIACGWSRFSFCPWVAFGRGGRQVVRLNHK